MCVYHARPLEYRDETSERDVFLPNNLFLSTVLKLGNFDSRQISVDPSRSTTQVSYLQANVKIKNIKIHYIIINNDNIKYLNFIK